MTVTTKSIQHKWTQVNGGYIGYWKLIGQFPSMLASLLPQLREQYKIQKAVIEKSPGIFSPLRLAITQTLLGITGLYLVLLFIIKLPWWLLVKPLGAGLYHTIKHYEVTVRETDKETIVTSYSRKLTAYIFRVFPLSLGTSHSPGKSDLKTLFKDKPVTLALTDRRICI